MSNVNSVTTNDIGKTDRGTRIVKPGSDMDKNAFLKILTAEMSNQDPQNATDSTQYVAQLAQFSSLEQMSNLNQTMTLSAASDLVGKTVNLDELDSQGKNLSGVVQSVNCSSSGNVTLSVLVNDDGVQSVKNYNYSDITKVLNVPDTKADSMNSNISLLLASSMMGNHVQLNSKDSNGNYYAGVVKGMDVDNGIVKLKVQLDGTSYSKDFTYDEITNATTAGDTKVDNMDNNLSFLLATSLLGTHVQLNSMDSKGNFYGGYVRQVNRENGTIKLNVLIDGTNETKDFTYDEITNVHGV